MSATLARICILALSVAGVMAAPGACYSPPQPDCGFVCGASGACPDGYTCGEGNRCRRIGAPTSVSCGSVVDAAVSLGDAEGPDSPPPVDADIGDAPSDATPDAMPDAMPDAATGDTVRPTVTATAITDAAGNPLVSYLFTFTTN